MRIGEMRDRATLLEPGAPENAIGQPKRTYKPRAVVWAKLDQLRTADVARYRSGGMQTTAILTIRLNRTITNEWQVDVRGVRYAVTSVTEIDRRWTEIGLQKGPQP